MFEAQRLWSYRFGDFAQHFRYQYVLSRCEEPLDGFAAHDCGDWTLHTGTGLPCYRVTDCNGKVIGCVIGIAVGPDGIFGDTHSTLPIDSTDPDFWDRFEAFIVDVAGRYAFVLGCQGGSRLYTDPVGMIGAVYNAEESLVAASTLLALKRPVIPNPKFDFETIEHEGGKIPLFHTADAHVKRLNPNFFLDLDTFQSFRFWPRDETFAEGDENPIKTYAQINQRTAFNIGEIASHHATVLPVTGGQDSRLLLAFASPHLSKIQLFYTHINNYATRRDAAIGQALCQAAGVSHHSHDKRSHGLTRKQARLLTRAFHITSGAPHSPPREYLNGVIDAVPENSVILRAHQTDLLRAVFVFRPKEVWHEEDWQIERLLIVPRARFDQTIADAFRDDFRAWRQTLPPNAHAKAVDFMFLELYYNCTVGTTFPALWKHFYVSPFNSRRLISLALGFDERMRRNSEPVFEMLELIDEGLSKVPFDFEWAGSLTEFEDSASFATVTKDRRDRTLQKLLSYSAPTGNDALSA